MTHEQQVNIDRRQQRVDVALKFATSYKEWDKGEYVRVSIKRAIELTDELFDGLEKEGNK